MPLIIENTYSYVIGNAWLKLLSLHPSKYSQGLCYYSFVANLDRKVGCCNTLNYLCNKACFPDKTEDWNLCIFNMVTRMNQNC